MTIEKYVVPRSIEEALHCLASESVTMFAGGTDLMPQTKSGARSFQSTVMNLNRLDELKGITLANDIITIGARTTVTDILFNPLLQEHAPVLSETADCFASGQVRNSATLGGNICNASPAGDMIIPLLLLDAEVELASCGNPSLREKNNAITTRRIPLHEFFLAPGRTKREPNELLTKISFPLPPKNFIAHFKKFGTRPALDISVVSIGIAGVWESIPSGKENGSLTQARAAFGAVAPTPLRLQSIEQEIERESLSGKRIGEIAGSAKESIKPIDDIRASAWYRKEVTHTLTKRILDDISKA